MEDKVIEGFKKDFLTIKRQGWILSNRKHDTGIGNTFEDLIGTVENNNFLADYKNVLELKSKREPQNLCYFIHKISKLSKESKFNFKRKIWATR